ncbi:MAG: DUF2339 domain-containing protein, partial [Lentisphaeria bacterium]|nr:DUF2339 domain-containing protein [Lentisphaeria bacterium]
VCRRVFNWIIVGEEYRDPSKTVEFAVATTWGVRIGISIFVAGVLFGLKLSFDYGIIGPSGRVALGLLVGAGMLVGGVKLLGRKAQLLGLGLMGGGLATLYATSFAAHQMYEIVNSWTAFGMMGAVTLVAGLLAIRFSSLLVAVLGIIGGYATPFVLSGNADAGYISFFAYLLLLGAGILLICRYRDWPLLNYLGLGFCMVHVLTTLDGRYGSAPFAQVMPMLVLLFLLYSTVMVLHNIVARKSCTLIELGGLTANSAVFFGVSQALIRAQFSSEAIAILTIGLAIFYIGLVFILMKRGLLDRGLLLSLITLGSFYVCMTMPLLLSREWLTASWAVQALLMLWLSRRTGSRFLQALSYVVFGIMLFRLGVFDLPRTYPWRPDRVPSVAAYLPDMLQHILTFGIPIAALAWACRLHALPAKSATGGLGEGNDIPRLVPDSGAVMAFLVLATLVGFIFSTCETNLFMRHFVPNLRVGAISILWALFALSWIVFGISRDFRKLRLCGLGLFAVVACKVVLVDLEGLGAVYRMVALMIMGVIILGGSFIYLRNAEKFSRGKEEE